MIGYKRWDSVLKVFVCTGILYMFCVTLVNMEDTIVDGEMGNIVMLNETDIPGSSLHPVN